MNPYRFRQRYAEVDAIQWRRENEPAIRAFCEAHDQKYDGSRSLFNRTRLQVWAGIGLDGTHGGGLTLSPGDWLVCVHLHWLEDDQPSTMRKMSNYDFEDRYERVPEAER